MARLKDADLVFDAGCPDCGERQINLPAPLPQIDDDFDWRTRDYDSFRLFLMQELALRFPERSRWTAADMEVVIAELLAAGLDRASHALDAIQAERFLETARRPESVRRLLKLIGYDALERTDPDILDNWSPLQPDETETERLERYWRTHPDAMDSARRAGPRRIFEVRRMVTIPDHETLTQEHPLVAVSRARLVWSGAWSSVLIAVVLEDGRTLNATANQLPADLWTAIEDYHRTEHIDLPPLGPSTSLRQVLTPLIETRRMAGTEVFLEDAQTVPIDFALSVRAKPGFFRSELLQAVTEAFSTGPDGFFRVGQFGFGEDIYASDIIEAAMAIEGVEVACLNRFKRAGDAYPDRTSEGFVPIGPDEVAECRNLRGSPEFGRYRIAVQGGEAG